jgi:hypothetical protein
MKAIDPALRGYAGIGVMRCSGGAVGRGLSDLDAVAADDAPDHLGHLNFTLQPALGLRGGHDGLEDRQCGGCLRKGPCGADRAMPDGSEHTRDRIRCPPVIPVLGGEVIEGPQGTAVLGQALDGTGVLGPILFLEDGERGFRRLAVRRHPDLPQVLLDHGLDVRPYRNSLILCYVRGISQCYCGRGHRKYQSCTSWQHIKI